MLLTEMGAETDTALAAVRNLLDVEALVEASRIDLVVAGPRPPAAIPVLARLRTRCPVAVLWVPASAAVPSDRPLGKVLWVALAPARSAAWRRFCGTTANRSCGWRCSPCDGRLPTSSPAVSRWPGSTRRLLGERVAAGGRGRGRGARLRRAGGRPDGAHGARGARRSGMATARAPTRVAATLARRALSVSASVAAFTPASRPRPAACVSLRA